MKIGAQYQGDERGPKAFAKRAEAAGFDSVWCGDHVGHYVDGIATLGMFAGATDHIGIGVNLLVLPYRPAAVVAKALATIALAAPGRLIAGFGVGGEFPGEFTATGAELRTRGAYADEALDVIDRLWSGAPVTHHGRFVELDEFTLEPPPSPRPAVWIGGRSDAALRRAVRFGDGYVPYLVSPQQLRKRADRLRELAVEAGRSLDDFTVAALVTLIPGPSVEASIDVAMDALRLAGLTRDGVRGQYLLGDDESVLAKLQDYVDAGAQHLILGCIPGEPRLVEDFFAACDRLLPAARALVPNAQPSSGGGPT